MERKGAQVPLTIGKYLSKGEEENVIRNERIRRRNVRMSQTRGLAYKNATKVFNAVKAERALHLGKLGAHLKEEWIKSKDERIAAAGMDYENCLQQIGEGHNDVLLEEVRIEVLKSKVFKNNSKSENRGKVAMEELIKSKSQELLALNSKKDLRKKMCEFGNRVGQVKISTSETKIAAPSNTENHLIKEMSSMAINNELEYDARLAAEQEHNKYLESEMDYERQKSELDKKTKERFSSALKMLHREKEMKDFVNKLEEMDDLDDSYGTNGAKTELNENCEKAVEKLFEKLGIPVRLPNLESSTSTSTGRPSTLISNSTSELESPTHIVIAKPKLNSVKTTLPKEFLIFGNVYKNGFNGSSTLSSPMASQTDTATSSSDLISQSHTDDEKTLMIRSNMNKSETILAGNFGSAETTTSINFTNSTFSSDSSVSKTNSGTTQSDFLKQNNKSSGENAKSRVVSIGNHSQILEFSTLKERTIQNEDVKDNISHVLKINEKPEIIKPNVFHNVVIRKKSENPVSGVKTILQEPNQRQEHLKNILSLSLLSKKQLEALTEQKKCQDQSITNVPIRVLSSINRERRLIGKSDEQREASKVRFREPCASTLQSVDLSTIMEIDSPGKSANRDSCSSSLFKYHADTDSDNLFEMICSNENGILEEPDLTLVSTITSASDFQRSSFGSSKHEEAPFIVTKVKSGTVKLNSGTTNCPSNNVSKTSSDSLAFLNKTSVLQTPTLNSASWRSCMTDGAKSNFSFLSPIYHSTNQSFCDSTPSSLLKSVSDRSDDSITGELLSNSLMSFLAHEVSASGECDPSHPII